MGAFNVKCKAVDPVDVAVLAKTVKRALTMKAIGKCIRVFMPSCRHDLSTQCQFECCCELWTVLLLATIVFLENLMGVCQNDLLANGVVAKFTETEMELPNSMPSLSQQNTSPYVRSGDDDSFIEAKETKRSKKSAKAKALLNN